MGYSKKLYNVLGGVTSIIIACTTIFDYSQNSQILQKRASVFVYFSQKQFVQYYQISDFPAKTFSAPDPLRKFSIQKGICFGLK